MKMKKFLIIVLCLILSGIQMPAIVIAEDKTEPEKVCESHKPN